MVCVLAFAMDADAVNENIFNFTNCIPIRSLFFWRALIKKILILNIYKSTSGRHFDYLKHNWKIRHHSTHHCNVVSATRFCCINGFVLWLILLSCFRTWTPQWWSTLTNGIRRLELVFKSKFFLRKGYCYLTAMTHQKFLLLQIPLPLNQIRHSHQKFGGSGGGSGDGGVVWRKTSRNSWSWSPTKSAAGTRWRRWWLHTTQHTHQRFSKLHGRRGGDWKFRVSRARARFDWIQQRKLWWSAPWWRLLFNGHIVTKNAKKIREKLNYSCIFHEIFYF